MMIAMPYKAEVKITMLYPMQLPYVSCDSGNDKLLTVRLVC